MVVAHRGMKGKGEADERLNMEDALLDIAEISAIHQTGGYDTPPPQLTTEERDAGFRSDDTEDTDEELRASKWRLRIHGNRTAHVALKELNSIRIRLGPHLKIHKLIKRARDADPGFPIDEWVLILDNVDMYASDPSSSSSSSSSPSSPSSSKHVSLMNLVRSDRALERVWIHKLGLNVPANTLADPETTPFDVNICVNIHRLAQTISDASRMDKGGGLSASIIGTLKRLATMITSVFAPYLYTPAIIQRGRAGLLPDWPLLKGVFPRLNWLHADRSRPAITNGDHKFKLDLQTQWPLPDVSVHFMLTMKSLRHSMLAGTFREVITNLASLPVPGSPQAELDVAQWVLLLDSPNLSARLPYGRLTLAELTKRSGTLCTQWVNRDFTLDVRNFYDWLFEDVHTIAAAIVEDYERTCTSPTNGLFVRPAVTESEYRAHLRTLATVDARTPPQASSINPFHRITPGLAAAAYVKYSDETIAMSRARWKTGFRGPVPTVDPEDYHAWVTWKLRDYLRVIRNVKAFGDRLTQTFAPYICPENLVLTGNASALPAGQEFWPLIVWAFPTCYNTYFAGNQEEIRPAFSPVYGSISDLAASAVRSRTEAYDDPSPGSAEYVNLDTYLRSFREAVPRMGNLPVDMSPVQSLFRRFHLIIPRTIPWEPEAVEMEYDLDDPNSLIPYLQPIGAPIGGRCTAVPPPPCEHCTKNPAAGECSRCEAALCDACHAAHAQP